MLLARLRAQTAHAPLERKHQLAAAFVKDLVAAGLSTDQAFRYHVLPKAFKALKASDKLVYLPSGGGDSDALLPWMTATMAAHHQRAVSDSH